MNSSNSTPLPSKHLDLSYSTCVVEVPITNSTSPLKMRTLSSLDQTIDQLYDFFKGQAHLGLNPDELLDQWCPYFGVFWASAGALSRHIQHTWGRLPKAPSRAVEIGCGLALPSFTATRCGASEVFATDTHPEVLTFLEENKRLNQNPPIHFIQFSYQTQPADYLIAQTGPVNVLYGSDILYDRNQPGPLARFIRDFLELHQKKFATRPAIWITDPGRGYLQAFVDEIERLDLKAETSILRSDFPENRDIFLITIR